MIGRPPIASVGDQRREAKRRLPRVIFDFVDGGAEGETTLHANRAAFAAVTFRPRNGVCFPSRQMATRVLGQEVALPVLIAPCGAARLVHPDGERALGRAASEAGTVYVFPHVGGHLLKEAVAGPSAPWYQLYLNGGREMAKSALDRAWEVGCRNLVLTIDLGARGVNERNVHNGLDQLLAGKAVEAARYVPQLLARPQWLAGFFRDGVPMTMPNIVTADGRVASLRSPIEGRGPTWEDIAWIRRTWQGSVVVKGIVSAHDAQRAVDLGASALVVSNHGGRQLDGTPASLSVLPEIVAAVGDEVEVLLDGGVMRGSDVVKALCLGARAVLIGRAAMWGLACAGRAGVQQTLTLFAEEIDRTLALLGCADVADLDPSFVGA